MEKKLRGRPETTGVIPGRYALSVGLPESVPPEGWAWRKLTDVARLESGHTPSRRKPEYWNGDVPWIGIKDARHAHGRDIHRTRECATELGIENSAARVLPTRTVCLSRTASIGYITRMGKPMSTSQDFGNWVCGSELLSRHLLWVLLADRESLFRFAHGSVHQTIYYPELKAFHVCLPPLDEQRRIAAVLGALDDKIELNRKMNRTLEEMAQAIFKSWFIDFDCHSDFVASDLGPIPKGWRVGRLDDVADVVMGASPKGTTYNDEQVGTPLINGPVEYGDYFPLKKKWTTAPTRLCREGDLIFCVRGSTTGRRVHSDGEYCLGRGVCAIRGKDHSQAFVDIAVEVGMERLLTKTTGSVFPNLSSKDIKSFSLIVPSSNALERFRDTVTPMRARLISNVREVETLAAIRDTLLPKLISGEIRVPAAEKTVEAVL
jgi:type I restriction enzyme, S subunit